MSVVVKNSGSQDALLVRARVHVLEAVYLRSCYSGGDIAEGGTFDVKLPAPGGGTTVDIEDLHQLIPKGGAGRFTLRFSSAALPKPGPDDWGVGGYLYRLNTTLFGPRGDQKPLEVPTIIVVAPVSTSITTQLVPERERDEFGNVVTARDRAWEVMGNEREVANAILCWRSNGRLFDRIVAHGGVMPPGVSSTAEYRSTSLATD